MRARENAACRDIYVEKGKRKEEEGKGQGQVNRKGSSSTEGAKITEWEKRQGCCVAPADVWKRREAKEK
jgi:hypothetical protein